MDSVNQHKRKALTFVGLFLSTIRSVLLINNMSRTGKMLFFSCFGCLDIFAGKVQKYPKRNPSICILFFPQLLAPKG